MDYQFSQTKFNDTFNVKMDKAADSLRLTHTQDICFKLFPYKASGKAQAPIITELDEVVSAFFRKALDLETEPIQYELLCDNIIADMDIEEKDVDLLREMIQLLFFDGNEFVAKNLGLYPYQTRTNNKSAERLAIFLLNVLGLDEGDRVIVEQTIKEYPYNVVEKMLIDAAKSTKHNLCEKTKAYFPIILDVQKKFKEDFHFMLEVGMTSIEDFSNLLSVYYFYYMSQACVTLDQFCQGNRNVPVQLY